MKARLIEQYDLTLSKREMGELMLALRVFVREFEASPDCAELLDELEDVYVGGGAGLSTPSLKAVETLAPADADEDEGGAAVAVGS
jgi:hypothetical protein